MQTMCAMERPNAQTIPMRLWTLVPASDVQVTPTGALMEPALMATLNATESANVSMGPMKAIQIAQRPRKSRQNQRALRKYTYFWIKWSILYG